MTLGKLYKVYIYTPQQKRFRDGERKQGKAT
jgi:hypothetical protein